jgi:hypothetical protein
MGLGTSVAWMGHGLAAGGHRGNGETDSDRPQSSNGTTTPQPAVAGVPGRPSRANGCAVRACVAAGAGHSPLTAGHRARLHHEPSGEPGGQQAGGDIPRFIGVKPALFGRGCGRADSAPGTARAAGTRSDPSAPSVGCTGQDHPGLGWPLPGAVLHQGRRLDPLPAPNHPAPPFAEYASGHSTFSMAAAEVLTSLTCPRLRRWSSWSAWSGCAGWWRCVNHSALMYADWRHDLGFCPGLVVVSRSSVGGCTSQAGGTGAGEAQRPGRCRRG